MRKKLQKFNDIFSWVLLIAMAILLVFSIYTVRVKGEVYLFGYRPVLVLTGSMEPYMQTNSICITKKVDDISEIAVDDVITFHIPDSKGNTLSITHRILSIEDGIIHTKGDNNNVADKLQLTIDDVDAKVVCVFNQTAWIAAKWQTTSGKVFLISMGIGIILAYFTIKMFISGRRKKDPEEEASIVVEGEVVDEAPAETGFPEDPTGDSVMTSSEIKNE